jgi:hypothetical protein
MGVNSRRADRIGGALAMLAGGLELGEAVRLLPYNRKWMARIVLDETKYYTNIATDRGMRK